MLWLLYTDLTLNDIYSLNANADVCMGCRIAGTRMSAAVCTDGGIHSAWISAREQECASESDRYWQKTCTQLLDANKEIDFTLAMN